MDYHSAKQLIEGKEGCKCTIITQNPYLIGGSVFLGVFKGLSPESLSINTDDGRKELALKQITKIHFE